MIDRQLAGFLEEGLGIHIGTRDAHLEPAGARGIAVQVEDGGTHLLVYVAGVAADRILGNLASHGQAAVAFARPVDDRACQVKGTFESVRAATAEDRPQVAAQWDRFLGQLERIGIPRAATAGWITWPAVVIRLRVSAVFEQTPGPKAGARLA